MKTVKRYHVEFNNSGNWKRDVSDKWEYQSLEDAKWCASKWSDGFDKAETRIIETVWGHSEQVECLGLITPNSEIVSRRAV